MGQPRTRRDPRRERTRRKILDATTEIVREGGIGALTTVEITRRAGISQPAFYKHFKNVDACLTVAAHEICDRVRLLYAMLQQPVIYWESTTEIVAPMLEQILKIAMAERQFAELFVRHRLDRSPLGAAMREVLKEARKDLTDNLWDMAAGRGIRGRFHGRVEMLADLVASAVVSGLEALVEDRVHDISGVALAIARQVTALTTVEFDEMEEQSK